MATSSLLRRFLITIFTLLVTTALLATVAFYYKAYKGDFDQIKSMGGGSGSPDGYHICYVTAVAVLPYRREPSFYYEIKVPGASPEILRIMVKQQSDLTFIRGDSAFPIEWSPDSDYVIVKANDASIRFDVRKISAAK